MMNKEDKKKLEFYSNHPKPVTRRDFLSLGLIGFSGMALLPNLGIASVNSNFADFAGGDVLPSLDFPAFLVFDLAGGAGLPGNFLVGNKGGPEDLLSSYNQLGWDPRKDTLDRRYGIPMAGGNVSKIMQGMNAVMSAEAQAKFRMGTILNSSLDDTSSNRMSALSMASKFGIAGSNVSNTVGMMTSNSGGNSRFVFEDIAFKPVQIASTESIDPAKVLGERLKSVNATGRRAFGKWLYELGMHQAKSMATSERERLMNLTQAQYSAVAGRIGDFVTTDPRANITMQQLYQINTNTGATTRNAIIATLVMNVLTGVTGPGVITIGGCDYHDGSQTSGDAKDLEIGTEIGRAVEAAHRMKRPLFIQIITDGGVYPKVGTRQWIGDSTVKSMTVIGYYNPNATPTFMNGRMQVGNYTDGQGVDQSHFLGNSPTLAAYAAFANFLNVSGKIGEFEKFAPGIFSRDQLESVLLFED